MVVDGCVERVRCCLLQVGQNPFTTLPGSEKKRAADADRIVDVCLKDRFRSYSQNCKVSSEVFVRSCRHCGTQMFKDCSLHSKISAILSVRWLSGWLLGRKSVHAVSGAGFVLRCVASKQKNKAKAWALHRHTHFCNGAKYGQQMKDMLSTALAVGTAVKMGLEPDLKCESVNGEPVAWRESQTPVSACARP